MPITPTVPSPPVGRCRRTAWLPAALVLLTGLPAHAEEPDADVAYAESTLRGAGFGTDGPALLKFFRDRTLTEADRDRLVETIRRLGSPDFKARQKAYRSLLSVGRPALPFLRKAQDDPDLEIARSAERLVRRIEGGTDSLLASAAAQLLAERRPEGAARALLAYLPQADDEVVQEAILTALEKVAVRAGKVDPALLAAADDREPARRAAAAHALGKARPEQRKVVRRLLRDDDPRVRLQAANALVHAGDRDAVAVLIGLLAEGPMDAAWQAEDLLCRLAGDKVPATLGGSDPAGRRACRDKWGAWWKDAAARVDLARLNREDALRGLTVIVEHDGAGKDNQGRIWECGKDGKPRWELDTDLGGPLDVQLLPGNRVLVAEYSKRRVTVRDRRTNQVLWEKTVNNQVVSAQRLPNGNTFIASFSELLEVDPKGKTVFSYAKPPSIYFARKLPNKHILYANSSNQIVELDAGGKEVLTINVPGSAWGGVQKLPNGRFLVALYSAHRVVEVNRAGKVLWECKAQWPTRAWRLPNGHTLVASADKAAVEYDRAGKDVWAQKTQGRVWAVLRH